MSMYIIYPADELIEVLLNSEYSVSSLRRRDPSRSPILPPLGPIQAYTKSDSQDFFIQSSSSPLLLSFSNKIQPDVKNSIDSQGESDSFSKEKKKVLTPSCTSTIQQLKHEISTFESIESIKPFPPIRTHRRSSLLGNYQRVQPISNFPNHSQLLNTNKLPKSITNSTPLRRITFETKFERIHEENEDDEFSSFRQRSSQRKINPSSLDYIKKIQLNNSQPLVMSSRDTSETGLSSLRGSPGGPTFRDLLHPNHNESLKSHNALTFKLIRIVSDFTQQLSQLHDQHAAELQLLVENFRKRNAEIRKERPPCSNTLFQVWETLLQEVEIDSQAHSDVAGSLSRQVARQLLEKTFCLKIQSRKIFAHRESFETLLSKTENLLSDLYREYCEACQRHVESGSNKSLSQYYDAHNAYVQQLRGTNAMLNVYQSSTLPELLQELEEIYVDLCKTVGESVLEESQIIANRAQEGNRRYENLKTVCQNINGVTDLKEYVKSLTVVPPLNQRHAFTLPVPLLTDGGDLLQDPENTLILKNEVISAPSARSRYESIKKEIIDLQSEIKQLSDSVETLQRMQQRSLDSNLFNKANELQEEISMKMFDLRLACIHLASLRAQRELYSPPAAKFEGGFSGAGSDSSGIGSVSGQGSSNTSTGVKDKKFQSPTTTMKSKWIKAFRSLKSGSPTPSPTSSGPTLQPDKKSAKEKDCHGKEFQIFENHIFQEYTYKKITPCDICSKILRGHTRQGLRCRMCKMNIHLDCQDKVEKCLPKTRLLRRQRSTSELETRLTQLAEADQGSSSTLHLKQATGQRDEPDLIYQVLKQATDLKKPSGGGSSSGSGSGSGFLGSSQTLHSQQDFGGPPPPGLMISRRSNPAVNIIGNPSGSISGGGTLVQPPSFHPSSSGVRRDSYVRKKSVSADADAGISTGLLVSLPPSRAVSLPSTTQSLAPHSPRRRKLDLRMKSFSLDSPESTEIAQRRRYTHGSQSTSHSQYYWKEFLLGKVGTGGGGPPSTFLLNSRKSVDGSFLLRNSTFSATTNTTSSTSTSAAAAAATVASQQLLLHFSPSNSSSPLLSHFAPSSPVHNRRALLSARNVRMSSVELPDENDKSLSSASTSPCPSPKPHRLLPTNIYVVLYMFKARHPDELDLKAGFKLTVTDTTDPDWWQGKCLGRQGYFPSTYVTKLQAGEKALQVTHNLQVTDGADSGLKLLRDQIVIQIGEETNGMVMIRNGENKQGQVPLKYLQEV